MMCHMLENDSINTHITESLIPAYAEIYNRMMCAIKAEHCPLGVTVGERGSSRAGGYFVWLTLPKPLVADGVKEQAQRNENLMLGTGHNSMSRVIKARL
jgi:DNA-binding transcriptional MocR family regulator